MSQKPTATISKISFSGGNSFQLNPNEKIIIVGPNNSGKSQTLREIMAIAQKGEGERTVVVTDLEIKKNGGLEQLKQFLEDNAEFVNSEYRFNNWQVHESHTQLWTQNYLMHGIAAGYIKNIAANDRLTICNQQNSISPGDQKTKPQHILYDDEALMNKISLLFKRAFGKDIMFDYRGGRSLPIHVGDNPMVDGVVDRVGDTYVQSVRSNPLLDKQGDGMKSYAGILFEAIVTDLDITLIDEPEAFLHPPQMRRLGETLSSEVRGQLVVATHSSDILRGFLEGTRGNVRILRVQREGDKNVVSEASNETIKSLWDKPELRYSNALEGIFHEQTIICEDDSDCRLINSIGDHLELNSNAQWLDTAYIPTGGKHGVPKIAKTLREVGVPVKAVFDIDFLSESSLVKATVDAFGGCWTKIEPLWRRVDAAVRGGNKPKSKSEMKKSVTEIINKSGDDELPKGDIIEAMKQGKPWSVVKKFGFRGIPHGEAQTNYQLLKDSLEDIGIYLVPVGEIENFCPQIGSHGPKFITKLLTTIPLGDPQLNDLRNFVDLVHKGKHCNLKANLVSESEKIVK
ncbi:ATP-dependent nuclease [Pseudoalteromonas sp. SWYJZ19]|uniref:ATP-dependent nuclease n=1 Tax=Pseudoalteromonas sp. SWYJZ19 TaxID=2792068 RepID=UPI0018CF5A8C|nr:AAA family ATPase [Pseudoalteromonas sp. SWYJZ19]MBH0048668.1 AAA family ATPase [Pseudoalteromonas sp. SWYJZ19]